MFGFRADICSADCNGHLDRVISQGLDLLISILACHDISQLPPLLQEPLSITDPHFLEGLISLGSQDQRRSDLHSEQNHKEVRRDPLTFRGDSEADARTGPPFAWTIHHGGTYKSLYGDYIGEDLERWGYVFWDFKRLERARRVKISKDFDDFPFPGC